MATWWKWKPLAKPLEQPLSGAMRQRLELGLAVIVTGAAIVGLSTVIRPDPSRLAKLSQPTQVPYPSRDDEPYLRPEPRPPPKVAPEFANAVAQGDLATMTKLYVPGMPMDEMLGAAASSGKVTVVEWVLSHGADPHESEETIDAPTLLADEHPDIAAVLVAHGTKEPALATAAAALCPNAVTRLLAAGADPEHTAIVRVDTVEVRPLTAAVRACDLQRIAEPSATTHPCVGIVKLLVGGGAHASGEALGAALSVSAPVGDAILDTVLTAKIEPGATAIGLTQMDYGAPPRRIAKVAARGVDWAWHEDEDDASLPLVATVRRRDTSGTRSLLDAGARANQLFKGGTSALDAALVGLSGEDSADDARLVELLIARGADVNRRLHDGRTPLFAAAEAGNLRVINALLDRGARVNEIVLDDTAVDAAEQNSHVSAARVLHARGGRRAPKRPPWDR